MGAALGWKHGFASTRIGESIILRLISPAGVPSSHTDTARSTCSSSSFFFFFNFFPPRSFPGWLGFSCPPSFRPAILARSRTACEIEDRRRTLNDEHRILKVREASTLSRIVRRYERWKRMLYYICRVYTKKWFYFILFGRTPLCPSRFSNATFSFDRMGGLLKR